MSKFVLSAFGDEIDPDLNVQMDTLEANGVRFIEMRAVDGKNITKHLIPEVKVIKKRLEERSFAVSSLGSPIGKVDISLPFAEHLDLFKYTLEIAVILDTKYMRMFSFQVPQDNPASYRNQVMERLGEMVTVSKGSGITLLHENEKHIYGDNIERCLDILQNVPEIRAVFDPANFMQCQVDSLKAFTSLEKYVDYMHIKDFSREIGMVVPAGKGDGQLPEILRRLEKGGFEGFLSLEPHLKRLAGMDNLYLKTGANGQEMMTTAIAALKSILAS